MRLRSHLISPFFLIAFPLYPSVCLAWKLPQQHLWFRFAPSAPGFQRKPGLSPGALLAMSGPILDGSGNGLDKPPLRVSSQNPGVSSEDGVKLFSGPASRNMGPILEVFKGILPTGESMRPTSRPYILRGGWGCLIRLSCNVRRAEGTFGRHEGFSHLDRRGIRNARRELCAGVPRHGLEALRHRPSCNCFNQCLLFRVQLLISSFSSPV